MIVAFEPTDALLIVDVQNDFLPGGALAVQGGDQIVPVLNAWIDLATVAGVPVYASRDWHPTDHLSFTEQGGPWPRHCVKNTFGAAFSPLLTLPDTCTLINKATDATREAYSAFDGTLLAETLQRKGVKRIWVGGLALDYCVKASMLDAIKAGFEIFLIPSGTEGMHPETSRQALLELENAGAHLPVDAD